MSLWVWDETQHNGNFWFGGLFGDNNTYPMTVEYEWFRFYKFDGDASYPCPNLDDSCLTEDDRYLSSNNPCDGIDLGEGDEQRTPCDTAVCLANESNFVECTTPTP